MKTYAKAMFICALGNLMLVCGDPADLPDDRIADVLMKALDFLKRSDPHSKMHENVKRRVRHLIDLNPDGFESLLEARGVNLDENIDDLEDQLEQMKLKEDAVKVDRKDMDTDELINDLIDRDERMTKETSRNVDNSNAKDTENGVNGNVDSATEDELLKSVINLINEKRSEASRRTLESDLKNTMDFPNFENLEIQEFPDERYWNPPSDGGAKGTESPVTTTTPPETPPPPTPEPTTTTTTTTTPAPATNTGWRWGSRRTWGWRGVGKRSLRKQIDQDLLDDLDE